MRAFLAVILLSAAPFAAAGDARLAEAAMQGNKTAMRSGYT